MQTQQLPTERSYTSAGVEIFTIQSNQIGKWWPVVLGFLLKIKDAEWTTDDVYEDIVNTRAQVWGAAIGNQILGIAVTKILVTAKAKYGLVWICAGEGIHEGISVYPIIESWFKEMGCKYIEIQGRPGWKKLMTDYELKHVVLRKAL